MWVFSVYILKTLSDASLFYTTQCLNAITPKQPIVFSNLIHQKRQWGKISERREKKSNSIHFLSSFVYSYATTSLTAILSKHFKVASDQQLTFAPGEIYKQLKFEIINDDDSKGNKTFQVIFSSPQGNVHFAGPKLVNISIMYAQGRRKKDTLLVNDDVSTALKITYLLSVVGLENSIPVIDIKSIISGSSM